MVPCITMLVSSDDIFQCLYIVIIASLQALQIPLCNNCPADVAEVGLANNSDANKLEYVCKQLMRGSNTYRAWFSRANPAFSRKDAPCDQIIVVHVHMP